MQTKLSPHPRQLTVQDDNRWQRFVAIAETSRKVELARAFLARLRELDAGEGELVDGRSLADWLDWAEARACADDPLGRGVAGVFGEIRAIGADVSRFGPRHPNRFFT